MDNKALELGIEKILNPEFPEFSHSIELTEKLLEKNIKTEKAEIKTNNKYEEVYRSGDFKKLSLLTQEDLKEDPDNLLAKIYWTSAASKLEAVPDDILALGLSGMQEERAEDLENLKIKFIYERTLKEVTKDEEGDWPLADFDEVPEEKKSNTWYFIFGLILLTTGFYLFLYHPKEQVASSQDSATYVEIDDIEKLKPELPLPEASLEVLSEALDFKDILSEIEQNPENPVKLDLSQPTEPKELSDLLDSKSEVKEDPQRPTTLRGPHIVSGESKENPIVSGQVIAGQKDYLGKRIYREGEQVRVSKYSSLYLYPDEMEAEIAEVRVGDKLTVLGDRKDWLKVKSVYGRTGYVKKTSVE